MRHHAAMRMRMRIGVVRTMRIAAVRTAVRIAVAAGVGEQRVMAPPEAGVLRRRAAAHARGVARAVGGRQALRHQALAVLLRREGLQGMARLSF